MLVYGKNVINEIDKKKIKKAYCARKEYIQILSENKIKYELVDVKKLDTLVTGVHQGIVLDIHDYDYKDVRDINSDFVVLLDHIEDPHNLGAIIRTCTCAGVKEIIIPKDRAAKVNETVIKVSAGTIDKVDIIMTPNLVNAINYLKEKNYFVYATDMKGENYKKLDYSGKKVLVIGNEGSGVSRLVKESSDFTISIDMKNNTDSLNASVAAGILIFEMRD